MALLWLMLKFLLESVYAYASSDQGQQELTVILNTAEADGIDVPFYTPPSQGDVGTMSGKGDVGSDAAEQSAAYVAPTSTRKVTPKGA